MNADLWLRICIHLQLITHKLQKFKNHAIAFKYVTALEFVVSIIFLVIGHLLGNVDCTPKSGQVVKKHS
jgi:hypothetical protein